MKTWKYISFVLIVFAIGLVILNLALNSKLKTSESLSEQVMDQNRQLEQDLDSAKVYIEKRASYIALQEEIRKLSIDKHLIELSDINSLKRKGLSDPIEDLKKSLLDHQSILLTDSLIDGRQRFLKDHIHIINDQWVRALWESGHADGVVLLAFEVVDGGDFKWEIVAGKDMVR